MPSSSPDSTEGSCTVPSRSAPASASAVTSFPTGRGCTRTSADCERVGGATRPAANSRCARGCTSAFILAPMVSLLAATSADSNPPEGAIGSGCTQTNASRSAKRPKCRRQERNDTHSQRCDFVCKHEGRGMPWELTAASSPESRVVNVSPVGAWVRSNARRLHSASCSESSCRSTFGNPISASAASNDCDIPSSSAFVRRNCYRKSATSSSGAPSITFVCTSRCCRHKVSASVRTRSRTSRV